MQLNKEEALRSLQLSPELYASLVEIFVKQSESSIAELERATEETPLGVLGDIAHSVSGSAATLFAEDVHTAARGIEVAVRQGLDRRTALEGVIKLRAAFESLKKYLLDNP